MMQGQTNRHGIEQRSTFFTHQLKNGLQIVGEQMPDVESVALGFYVKTGGRDEKPDEDGVSHFLEHMVFKGTQNGLTAADINIMFHRIGASFNAATSRDVTYYYCMVLNEYYDQAFKLLYSMQRPKLDATEFNMERNVILEEIARSLDNPGSHAFRTLNSIYFTDHPLKTTILGSRESISTMQIETMRNYCKRRYVANNLIFSVAGHFDWDHVVQQAEEYCGDWESGEVGRRLLPAHPKPQFVVVTKSNLKGQLLAMMMPGPSNQNERDVQVAGLLSIIVDDDRLFWNVREKGLAEGVSFGSSPLDDTGVFSAYASTTPAKAVETFQAIRRELEHIQEPAGRITDDEMERAKNKLITGMVFGGESSMNRMFSNGRTWMIRNRLIPLDERMALIESITIDDIYDLLQRYPLTGPTVALTYGPMVQDEIAAAAPDLPVRTEPAILEAEQ